MIKAKVFHASRDSAFGERLADHLSKGEMQPVEAEWPDRSKISHKVLLGWIRRAKQMGSMSLWRKGMMELTSLCKIHIGKD